MWIEVNGDSAASSTAATLSPATAVGIWSSVILKKLESVYRDAGTVIGTATK